MPLLLNGKIVSNTIKEQLKDTVIIMGSDVPILSIIQVGDNTSSTSYIKQKTKFGEDIGVSVSLYKFDETVSKNEIVTLIQELNQKKEIGGIIVQLPLPKHLASQEIINTIDSIKDVDGLSANTNFFPATARGVYSLLEYYHIEIENKKVLVIGKSNLVGKPTAMLLKEKGANVLTADSSTTPDELVSLCHEVDIIITATGVPKLISLKHVLPHHIVVDIGITRIGDNLVGDVDFDSVKDHVLAISPVPGGVGPLTVASLFQNLLR